MKKNILFVIDSLGCAGAEKSLVTLLNLIDYSKYSIDLMLFSHGNILEDLVPKNVNILSPLPYTKFAELNLKHSFFYSIQNLDFKMFISRIKYSYKIRRINKSKDENIQIARIYWETLAAVIDNNPKIYDTAISYAQGVPTFYVAEKVKAKKKFAWVNVSYILEGKEKNFQKKFYDIYNKIVSVSDSTKQIFLESFPSYENKTCVIHDINNADFISDMANMGHGYEDDFGGLKILTIGRLNSQKGYDLALSACKMLKDKGINFKWYSLGKGPLEKEINKEIIASNLTNHFILLGEKANPYPYIKHADIYVQTSRFEGFGLAIAEARMLNIPVVTTRFDAVFNQMIDQKNGLVVDMNAEAVCEGIIKLVKSPTLRGNIISYLAAEKKGNIEEIEKFYQLIS